MSESLRDHYNQMYSQEKMSDGERVPAVLPIQTTSWPTDRRQAIVFLAKPGRRLLEVGCGQGEILATLSPQFTEVVGTELSPIRAQRAAQGLAHVPNCRVIACDLKELVESESEPFDCIVWADVIEHIVDVIGAMKNLARLARLGTQLVTVTPNIAFLPQRLRILRGQAPNTALPWHSNEGFTPNPSETVLMDAGHVHYFTYRQVEILYQLAGFQPDARLGMGSYLSRIRNYWPTLLSGQVCVTGTYAGPAHSPIV